MLRLTRHLRGTALALGLALPAALSAQIRASEKASISQTIDGTVITVEYSRPQARGRDSLFGGEVKWKEVWTPGANWATTLELSRDIRLDGHPVPKGKYSVWMVVEPEQWTVVLDPRAHLFHMKHPGPAPDQIRYVTQTTIAPYTEVLTWSFPVIRIDGAVLAMQWGRTQVNLDIRVEPSHPLTFARDSARAYLGSYSFRWTEDADTVKSSRITLTHERDRLIGKWDPAPDPDLASFMLVHIADGWFNIGTMRGGEVFEVDPQWVVEFGFGDGRAAGFELRGDKDKLEGTATRVQ
jgi:hypothetical protein